MVSGLGIQIKDFGFRGFEFRVERFKFTHCIVGF